MFSGTVVRSRFRTVAVALLGVALLSGAGCGDSSSGTRPVEAGAAGSGGGDAGVQGSGGTAGMTSLDADGAELTDGSTASTDAAGDVRDDEAGAQPDVGPDREETSDAIGTSGDLGTDASIDTGTTDGSQAAEGGGDADTSGGGDAAGSDGAGVDSAGDSGGPQPHVQFVAPYIGIANRPGTFIARGSRFDAGGSQIVVLLGDTEIGPLTLDSDTQVRVPYPALPAGRYPVTIKTPGGRSSTDAELVVLAVPALTYQAINAPSTRRKMVYDAERQTLYAINQLDQQIERYAFSNGSWTALPLYVSPKLTDIDLTPNGRSLLVLSSGAISEAPLNRTPFTAETRATNPSVFCNGFMDRLAVANNGKVFVIHNLSGCSGFTASYLYDVLNHSLTANPYFIGWLYNGIVGASADGSRVYAGSNGVSPAQAIKIFSALTNTIADGSAAYNLFAVSVSGNASRVILQNADVYSQSLSLTGGLPPGGVALASRDSSRAFVYRDDAGPPRLVVHDLGGALQSGALYPVVKTIELADAPSTNAVNHHAISLAATPDDAVVFVSGNSRILVVPVN